MYAVEAMQAVSTTLPDATVAIPATPTATPGASTALPRTLEWPATEKEAQAVYKKRITRTTRFGMQRKIVSYMTTESWQNVPHVTYMYEPDVTDFFDAFKQMDVKSPHPHKITFNTLITRAIIEGLKVAPHLNGHISYDHKFAKGKIQTLANIDISMPWILPNGEMMTINLHNCENRNLDGMTEYIADLTRRINNTDLTEVMYDVSLDNTLTQLKHGKIAESLRKIMGAKLGKGKIKRMPGDARKEYKSIDIRDRLTRYDLQPGTVTISNIGSIYREQRGAIGILEIIPPQIFAIAVGAVQDKPGVVAKPDGTKEIAVRKVLPICLALDHRALDFGDAVPFMKHLDGIFAKPEQIYSW
ncbi:MAG: 2-oxo acid dehydrogenase subunit E2 [Oscillospiraceae bacterium]|jgi:pyruvate dehydrogenase E2 component (dihydrolipoamide acetyltransferase)|nr:2-oxo acid dehydrogenase subunit E2 [Oscillospiraceae bacterium]